MSFLSKKNKQPPHFKAIIFLKSRFFSNTHCTQSTLFIHFRTMTHPKPIFSLFQNSTDSFLECPKNSKEKGKTLNKVSMVLNSYVKQEEKK